MSEPKKEKKYYTCSPCCGNFLLKSVEANYFVYNKVLQIRFIGQLKLHYDIKVVLRWLETTLRL